MMLLTSLILCSLVLGISSWFSFIGEAYPGKVLGDMWQAYSDMKEASWKNSDKYFHAWGNYDAAQRGPRGAWAAEVISDAKDGIPAFFSSGHKDSMADQEANRHDCSGEDPNHYRPAVLPDKY
ncbi:serum amyloid A-5 protein-like isoform X2 [Mus caroli]|uniref:Serum amyloid A protein n=1 Tax=Mus caroli TaxID=10089 RepID=A0A6P5Q6G7_MUSCR|nr:serum amyloid A-5 protein-like isoform X2 [Mus caroli]